MSRQLCKSHQYSKLYTVLNFWNLENKDIFYRWNNFLLDFIRNTSYFTWYEVIVLRRHHVTNRVFKLTETAFKINDNKKIFNNTLRMLNIYLILPMDKTNEHISFLIVLSLIVFWNMFLSGIIISISYFRNKKLPTCGCDLPLMCSRHVCNIWRASYSSLVFDMILRISSIIHC